MPFDVLLISFVVANQENVAASLGNEAGATGFVDALVEPHGGVEQGFIALQERMFFSEGHSVK